MARRAAPPGSGPAYYNPSALTRGPSNDPNESAFSRFLREQIFSPEKLPGNISIATGLGVFFGGILVMRRYGQLMVPV
ncbi:hypothetical protein PENSPDRAFT_103274 [Peniophora sp. CONT]|nr:hypothetical protein PENSPDRAFT_103274 [Peniophora sp. CONT]